MGGKVGKLDGGTGSEIVESGGGGGKLPGSRLKFGGGGRGLDKEAEPSTTSKGGGGGRKFELE